MNELGNGSFGNDLRLIDLDFAQNSTEQSTPSIITSVCLDVHVTSSQLFVALQMDVRREYGIVVARHVVAQIVLVQSDFLIRCVHVYGVFWT